MPTQAERRAATRRRILEAAQALFVRDGYEATTTAKILDAAGVSRGAMYHHFASKEDVFAAVYEAVSSSALARAARDGRHRGGPRRALVSGCLAWLEEVSRPEVARILFDLGPSALGWARCRGIEDGYSVRLLRRSIEAVSEAESPPVVSVDLAVRLINASLGELALVMVHPDAPSTPPTAVELRAAVEALVDGVLPRIGSAVERTS